MKNSRPLVPSCWNQLELAFPQIMHYNEKYDTILNYISLCSNNILLYCCHGFPLDLFIDEILKTLFDITIIHRTQHVWNKSVIYTENQYFFEIDLLNPENPKDLSCISAFILHIIQTKTIGHSKHFIIIKHIENLSNQFFDFRILLERYSQNVTFMCTTHSLSRIESPIKSRFSLFRIPLFTHEEIQDIFSKYLSMQLNIHLINIRSRDLIKAVFIADIEKQEQITAAAAATAAAADTKTNVSETTLITTKEFCMLNFPPLYDFIKSFDKSKDNLEEIRNMSYKCCQYNISILHIVEDLLKIIDYDDHFMHIKYTRIAKKNYEAYKTNMKIELIKAGTNIDNMLCQTNKGREPIYIEYLLCNLLL